LASLQQIIQHSETDKTVLFVEKVLTL